MIKIPKLTNSNEVLFIRRGIKVAFWLLKMLLPATTRHKQGQNKINKFNCIERLGESERESHHSQAFRVSHLVTHNRSVRELEANYVYKYILLLMQTRLHSTRGESGKKEQRGVKVRVVVEKEKETTERSGRKRRKKRRGSLGRVRGWGEEEKIKGKREGSNFVDDEKTVVESN